MKVRDNDLWQQQRAELDVDDLSRHFLEFMERWAEYAEEYPGAEYLPAEGFNNTLEAVEKEFGRVGAHFMGQMLVVLVTHWIYGEELMETLSPMERRLVKDMLVLKLSELETEAAEEVKQE